MSTISAQIKDLAVGSIGKWPQMLVTGADVTIEQAKDIILRTDRFLVSPSRYSGGNNHKFNQLYREQSGLSSLSGDDGIPVDHERLAELHKVLGVVATEYVTNDWASCSFIGGPHGWCSPQGKISFADNIGKYPSLEEVYEDWCAIATAFPYLDLHVTLMDGESCESDTSPVINFRVINGTVRPEAPNIEVHGDVPDRELTTEMIEAVVNGRNEIGLPLEWYDDFATTVSVSLYMFTHK